MTDDKRLDPRYDPAFQRGFEGTVTEGLRNRTSVRRTALVAPAPYRATAPEPEVEEFGVQEVEQSRASAEAGAETGTAAEPVRTVPLRDLPRNPFLVILSVLGIVLIIFGAAWANQVRVLLADRGGASTDLDYWFLQGSSTAAPLTILTGVGILAGVLFFAATAWTRRS